MLKWVQRAHHWLQLIIHSNTQHIWNKLVKVLHNLTGESAKRLRRWMWLWDTSGIRKFPGEPNFVWLIFCHHFMQFSLVALTPHVYSHQISSFFVSGFLILTCFCEWVTLVHMKSSMMLDDVSDQWISHCGVVVFKQSKKSPNPLVTQKNSEAVYYELWIHWSYRSGIGLFCHCASQCNEMCKTKTMHYIPEMNKSMNVTLKKYKTYLAKNLEIHVKAEFT